MDTNGHRWRHRTQWFREQGVERVELRTSAKNGPSIEFYQKHGFRIYDHMMTREI